MPWLGVLRLDAERMRHSIQADGMPCRRIESRSTTCTSSRRGALRELASAVVSLSWNCDSSL